MKGGAAIPPPNMGMPGSKIDINELKLFLYSHKILCFIF